MSTCAKGNQPAFASAVMVALAVLLAGAAPGCNCGDGTKVDSVEYGLPDSGPPDSGPPDAGPVDCKLDDPASHLDECNLRGP